MSIDRGQLGTMRLLPFTAAADEAAWSAAPGTISSVAPASRPVGRVWCVRSADLGECAMHAL